MSAVTVEAGRELDALVAEKVMGWVKWRSPMVPRGSTEPDCWRTNDPECPTIRISAWEPSTDIDDAWLVVERLNAIGWLVSLRQMPEGVPYIVEPENVKLRARVVVSLQWVQWMKDASAEAFKIGPTTLADTAPEGICRSALAALGAA